MRTGKQGNYYWVESASFDLHDALEAVPDVVLGRCVAVASFDSGTLIPTTTESELGWIYSHNVTYIPKVSDVRTLPFDHYDEWYILETPRDLGSVDRFVNFSGFGVSDPDERIGERDETWDVMGWRVYATAERERQMLFWAQMTEISPMTCVLNGDLFVLATKDQALFERIVPLVASAGPN